MGSKFQINDISNDKVDLEIKRVTLTVRDFHLTLVDEMKVKIQQSSQTTLNILLARYLIELGENRASKQYFNQLLDNKQHQNDSNLVAVYNYFGIIYFRLGFYDEALDSYRKVLDVQMQFQFSDNYVGQAHFSINQLDEAQENLE
ncbi:unnamed protein product [Adineta ricciae]|nr:unnamed protein product [Adineta ricciae]